MTIQHAKELRQGYREDVALHYANWAKMKQINSKYWNDFIIQCNLADYTLYEMAREWEYEKKWMQRVIELIQAEHDKHTPHLRFYKRLGHSGYKILIMGKFLPSVLGIGRTSYSL